MDKIANTSGPGYLWRGFKTMWRSGLKRYVLIPLAINSVLFGLGIWWLTGWFEEAVTRWLSYLPDWLTWLEYILWPVFLVAVLLVVFYGFTLLANLVGAPFNGFLAARVEEQETGRNPDSGRSIAAEVAATMASESKKLIYTLIRFALVGLVVLVLIFTPLSPLTPLLWLLAGGWLLGMEYLEYPMANHGHTFKDVRDYARNRRKLSLGFGISVSLMTALPILNLFVMPAAVVGATLLWLEHPPAVSVDL